MLHFEVNITGIYGKKTVSAMKAVFWDLVLALNLWYLLAKFQHTGISLVSISYHDCIPTIVYE